jgi:NADPH:quinone reductase
MATGRCWMAREFGQPRDVLKHAERAEPALVENSLLVRVEACGLGLPDYFMTRGEYPVVRKLPVIPGQEGAGVVIKAQPGSRYAPGDKVMGIAHYGDQRWEGALSDYVLLIDSRTLPIPAGWDFTDAAGFPVAFSTANCALTKRTPVEPGQSVLVLGASGSTGAASIILAKALGAAPVIAIASGKAKIEYCAELGADHVVDYKAADWVDQVLRLTGGRGCDIILDMVGGEFGGQALRAIARKGRLAVMGFASGSHTPINSGDMILRMYSAHGVSDYLSTPEEDLVAYGVLHRLASAGKIRPPVRKVFSFDEAPEAIQNIPTAPPGKMVVRVR